ncbi:TIR domain-containing protein [Chryseobacterium binzhouense]|uniref:TIR domain-containing protein n=1 Tax=Chryseobacterium binzhouense TaxID=2593646 RepID=UPI00117EEA07|nr:TIR domain-containing protein [Chryseobacterium binzhouense]
MSKIYNYCAFYVKEPFSESSLRAYATEDFCYYNMLKAWKGFDSTFPFSNAHDTTYNVRDSSDWENTLKPRLRERLRNSKNIILFLSDHTLNSRAINEEIDYGINTLNLPVIVIYPNLKNKEDLLTSDKNINNRVKSLWNKLPIFRDSKFKVPVLHIPLNKETIRTALNNSDFRYGSAKKNDDYTYKQ